TIYRDEYSVPHIIAQNEHDLFFAQGYVHAQDRLWQMDITRRAGEGRLSEILGSAALKYDKLFKTVGIQRIAEKLEVQLHPESKMILEAYSDGINAFIHTHRGKYPIEFDMLNYVPEDWQPVHTLIVSRMMAWELNLSWYVDLTLGELVQKFGEEKAKEIFPTYPENAPVTVPKELLKASGLLGRIKKKIAPSSEDFLSAAADFQQADQSFRKFFGMSGMHIGSNAWAVSAKKSASGFAMLANDPHLGLSEPSKWYEIHLQDSALDVAGVSLPGAPGIVIGHNRSIAWGMTNVMADDADFYIEEEDSLDHSRYQYKGEWKTFVALNDTIFVKDSDSVPVTIRESIHGPIINDVNPTATDSLPIALRWTGEDMSDELYAIYCIDKAQSWEEFKKGVKYFTVPGQNFVYADQKGNIGYCMGVRLPIRASQNPTMPMPGWTGSYDWTGFVPFEKLPELFNPPEEFVATANNKTTDASFPYHISNLWEPPSRIERIREFLSTRNKLAVADFEQMQLDYFSSFAKEMTPYIIHAFDSLHTGDQRIQTVLNYFRNWNFQETKNDVTTTLFHVFFTHLLENIFENKMGKELYKNYIFLANIPLRVVPALLTTPSSSWFDDPSTPGIETRDETIRKSLNEAASDLQQKLGDEMKTWQWGQLHTLTFEHPFGSHPPLGAIFNIGPFEVGGSGTTLNNGEYHLADPYRMHLGPSMRQIVDFSDLNGALSVIPTGESGQPLSGHYSDQTPLWLNGEYHALPINDAAVESVAKHRLELIPK
ncbi:MAG: penicillin acylase family protein, partial [Bacteroidota bacterium]|nr:penicillin acylase family protein [Bacteroidota bacterium]